MPNASQPCRRHLRRVDVSSRGSDGDLRRTVDGGDKSGRGLDENRGEGKESETQPKARGARRLQEAEAGVAAAQMEGGRTAVFGAGRPVMVTIRMITIRMITIQMIVELGAILRGMGEVPFHQQMNPTVQDLGRPGHDGQCQPKSADLDQSDVHRAEYTRPQTNRYPKTRGSPRASAAASARHCEPTYRAVPPASAPSSAAPAAAPGRRPCRVRPAAGH